MASQRRRRGTSLAGRQREPGPAGAGASRPQAVVPRGARERRLPSLLTVAVGVSVVSILAATLLFTRQAPLTAEACGAPGAATGLAVGQCAPDFTLADLQGTSVSLASLRGHPILLHFWAVGCTSCAAEYPEFSRVVQANVPKGLTVLAVDAWGESASLVQQWQSSHHLLATLLIDPAMRVFQQYSGQGTPTTFFIDRAGRVTFSNAGPLSRDAYQSAISHIL